MDLIKEFYKEQPALSKQMEYNVGKDGVKTFFRWFEQKLNSNRVQAEVKPESGGELFEMSIYTGRVNGSDTHQGAAQYINFVARDKKQLERLINLLCDRIRETNTADTHNEVLAEIIGKAITAFRYNDWRLNPMRK
jgi:hypothetical protein